MTREQLLHLVDRARRGVLLPAEYDLLVAGITTLAAERDTLEAVCESNKRAYVGAVKSAQAAEEVVARVRQMATHWERRLPEVIRTPAVVSALRAATDPAR